LPGTYALVLKDGSTTVATTTVTLQPMEYLPIQLPSPWAVRFNETGLSAGTSWEVTVGGSTLRSTSSSISTSLVNGTYGYSVAPVRGYRLPSYAGTVTVAGPTEVSVQWTRVVYGVTVNSSGLPQGVPWSIGVDGLTNRITSTTNSLTFSLPNGTYNYTVAVAYTYVPVTPNGTFLIQGGGSSFGVDFVIRLATLVGVLTPVNAILTLNGTEVPIADGSFDLQVAPGHYPVSATLPGYEPYGTNVSLTPGNVTQLSIELTQIVANRSAPPLSRSNQTMTTLYVGVGAGIATVVVVAAVAILLSQRRRAPPAPAKRPANPPAPP
jgi:hypothetical protein